MSEINDRKESAVLAPPSMPTDMNQDNKDGILIEPPLKRMKVDAPQMPHYNSHNIYSRPPAPPSTLPIPSLPVIIPPVTPLDNNSHTDSNSTMPIDGALSIVVAPLSEPTQEWPLCAYCTKGGDLSRCSSCRQAYYCNRDCQVAHWEVHCVICQPGPPQPPPITMKSGKIVKPTHNTAHSLPYNDTYSYSPRTPSAAYHGHPNGSGHGHRQTRSHRRNVTIDASGKEQYYCEDCDRYFKNGQALGGHRSRVHSSRRNGMVDADGTPIYNGPKKRRRPRPSRARHEPTGSGRYVCPHCSREFTSGNALGGHISGAHTKKSKRNLRNYQPDNGMPRYARPRHPNI